MQLRSAESRDLPAIVELYNACADTTYEYTEALHTLEERTEWLGAKRFAGWPVIVAEDESKVIGIATYGEFRDNLRWPGYRFTVEHTVHVAESHWRRGVGRTLIEALMDSARATGIRVMVAGIDSSNAGSIEFHARLGFHETARMPGVGEKWGRRLELVLMQREVDRPR